MSKPLLPSSDLPRTGHPAPSKDIADPLVLMEEVASLRQTNHVMARKLRGIEAISKSLVSETNLERMLATLLHRTAELLSGERATLYLLQKDNTWMTSTIAIGEEFETIKLKVGQGIAGWVAKHGKPVNVKDAYRDARFDRSFDEKTRYRTRSVLAWPLTNSRQQTIGVIQVLNKSEGYFTPADEDLLGAIASQAAITIQNSRLYLDIVGKNIELLETEQKRRVRKRELELLYAIERAAAQTRDLDATMKAIVSTICDELTAEGAAVVLHQDFDDKLVVQAASGVQADTLSHATSLEAPQLRKAFKTGKAQLLEQSQAHDATTFWHGDRGTLKVRSVAFVPIAKRDNQLGVLVVINRSGHKRTFEQDEPLLESVANRIGLSYELITSQKEEEKAERLAAIGRTLSSVVHDLKTPLTIINGYAQLLAKEGDDTRRSEYKALIQKQIAEIKGMTHEVLSFARGESQVLLGNVFAKTFLAEITEQLQPEFEASNVTLRVTPKYRGPLKIDRDKMKRVVFNLARNALEALEGRPGTFEIIVESIDNQAVFTFRDDGPGIPLEMGGRLFESFATHGKKDGTGLGLAIVKKVVDAHAGKIEVETATDQGTTFRIVLPTAVISRP